MNFGDIVEELGEARTAEATRQKLAGEMIAADAQSSAVSYAGSVPGTGGNFWHVMWTHGGCDRLKSPCTRRTSGVVRTLEVYFYRQSL